MFIQPAVVNPIDLVPETARADIYGLAFVGIDDLVQILIQLRQLKLCCLRDGLATEVLALKETAQLDGSGTSRDEVLLDAGLLDLDHDDS